MNKCFIGDCRETMRQLIADGIKVQMCVTSPPYYGLRDYGIDGQLGLEDTPEKYVDGLIEVFTLVSQLLKDDGILWLNLGDSYYNYRPGGGERKQTIAKTDQNNPVGAAKRGRRFEGIKEKDLIGIPWMVAFALRASGWYLRSDIIWNKPNPMPESVTDRPTKAHEYIFMLTKNKDYYYDIDAIREPHTTEFRPSRPETSHGKEPAPQGASNNLTYNKMHPNGRNKRSVWEVATTPYMGAHFATFPTDLITPCILAGSRPGDIVFDPFFGSGTTGQVSQALGRKWIGCELNPKYLTLQEERTRQEGFALC